MAAGRLVSLDASKFKNTLTGDYLITQVTHTLDQRHVAADPMSDFAQAEENSVDQAIQQSTAGRIVNLQAFAHLTRFREPSTSDQSSGPDYRCDLSLIPRETSYRPDLPERHLCILYIAYYAKRNRSN